MYDINISPDSMTNPSMYLKIFFAMEKNKIQSLIW